MSKVKLFYAPFCESAWKGRFYNFPDLCSLLVGGPGANILTPVCIGLAKLCGVGRLAEEEEEEEVDVYGTENKLSWRLELAPQSIQATLSLK